MSRKKRNMFDIDFEPAAEAPAPAPAGPGPRRGPMAAAISENAEALAARQEAERRIRAENDALAHEHVRLKKLGLITDLIAVAEVRTAKLTRDRSTVRDDEIDELKDSIRAVGLSNPIRVEQVDDGYELVQGFRRLTAFRELLEETGDARYARIPATLVPRGRALEELYRKMVDENLIRRDVSFGEMASLAIAYAGDPDTRASGVTEAVEILYASANRQKRSYIRNFGRMLVRMDGAILHVPSIPRALGLDLYKHLEAYPATASVLRARLVAHEGRTAEDEMEIIRAFLREKPPAVPAGTAKPKASAKTTLRLDRPEGVARCVASMGKVELRLDRDFASVERKRLEAALAAFFAALDAD